MLMSLRKKIVVLSPQEYTLPIKRECELYLGTLLFVINTGTRNNSHIYFKQVLFTAAHECI